MAKNPSRVAQLPDGRIVKLQVGGGEFRGSAVHAYLCENASQTGQQVWLGRLTPSFSRRTHTVAWMRTVALDALAAEIDSAIVSRRASLVDRVSEARAELNDAYEEQRRFEYLCPKPLPPGFKIEELTPA